ncbi:MAG: sulfatase [Candidatus Brocadiia bacterium]
MTLEQAVEKVMAKANIVFFHAESWDGRAMGCMGHPAMQRATPNLDQMAERGALFPRTYCTHPISCPSRANMWSGRYTHQCESWNNHKGLEPDDPTLMDQLSDAGYQFVCDDPADIGLGGSDYLSGHHTQVARVTAWTGPADIRLPVYGRGDQDVRIMTGQDNAAQHDWDMTHSAVDFLRQQADSDEPFFLYITTGMVHPRFRTTARWMEKVDLDAVRIPPEDEQLHPVMGYQQINKNWRHGFHPSTRRLARAVYYAMCAEADAMVGEIASAMDELGLRDDTYFIFSSDHGELKTEHRNWYKMNMYDGASRVPLIITGPGIPGGRRVDNIVSLIDIFPTLAEIADIECPDHVEGESLMPLALGKTDESRGWAFATHTGTSANTTMFMLRRDEWKYVAYPGYPPQLFDLEEDPDEIHNLAESRPEIVQQMDKKLRDIVDYEEVHERCIRYDKESFREWRKQAKAGQFTDTSYSRSADDPATTYEEIMANAYVGWSEEHEEKLNRWLEE